MKRKPRKNLMCKYLILSSVVAVVSVNTPAFAQNPDDSGTINDIIVTAQRRAESMQSVPLAVSAISGEDLGERGLRDIEELSRAVPGLTIGQTSGAVTPFLRGVGNNSVTFGNESSVAVYVDGVYFSRLPPGFFSLSNVERVEVLKGPQGTLFGRNSSGGVMQLVTRKPSADPTFNASVNYGRFQTVEGSAYLSFGVGDKMAADISISGRKQGDGYGDNVTTGHRANYLDHFTARTKWVFEPTDATSVTLAGHYSWSDVSSQGSTFPGTDRGYISLPNTSPQPTLSYYDGDDDIDAHFWTYGSGVSLTLEQSFSGVKFTSISAYIHTIFNGSSDSDFGARSDQVVRYGGPQDQFTQELQLASLGDGPLDWTVGAYYYNSKTNFDDRSIFYSPSGAITTLDFTNISYFKAKSFALYGQATFAVTPQLSVTGGLRQTWDRNSADGALIRFDGSTLSDPPGAKDKQDDLSFRAAIDYKFTNDVMAYASVSRGFKSAVFNILTYNPVPNRPEKLTAYEVGFKSMFANRKVRLNGAVYYYDLSGPQTQLITFNTVQFSNADAARVYGAELELVVSPTRNFNIRAGLNVLDSKYKKNGFGIIDSNGNCIGCAPLVIQTPDPATFGNTRTSAPAGGNYQPYAPKVTANLGFDYTLETGGDSEWNVSADYFYNDGYYFEADNVIHQPSFHIVNAQLRYSPSKSLAFRVWGKNLLDEKYSTRVFGFPGPQGYPYTPGAPAVYGVGVDVNF